jgi:carboxypeptidase T
MYSLVRDMDEVLRIGAGKGIAARVTVGNSSGGRAIPALSVGKGTSHKVLIVGCHHAREWISVEMAYYIAEYLVNAYTDTPRTLEQKRIKHLLLNRQITFVPMLNPDGHVHTVTSNRNWRPSRALKSVPAGSTVRYNGMRVSWPAGSYRGVDINRNYAVSNWGTETEGTTKAPPVTLAQQENSVWCGLGHSNQPSGEPESHAIDVMVRAPQPFRGTITFHSYGEQWLWPGPLRKGSGDPYVDWVGKGLVDIMSSVGHGYSWTGGPTPYLTAGDMADFVFEQIKGRPAYTPEVRPTKALGDPDPPAGIGFSFLPESEIEPCFVENLAATLGLINCAGHDAAASAQGLSTATGSPPQRCQFVKHCWEVFRNWRPYIPGKDIP